MKYCDAFKIFDTNKKMIHHLLNILPSYPLEYPGFVFLVW